MKDELKELLAEDCSKLSAKEYALFLYRRFYYGLYSHCYNKNIRKQVAKCDAVFVAKECYKEAYKQGTEISLIRQKYWLDVVKFIKKIK